MMSFWRWAGWLVLLPSLLAACQSSDPKGGSKLALPEAAPATVVADGPITQANWPDAGDCRGMVAVLKRGLNEGWIIDLDDTPFLLIDEQLSTTGGPRSTFARRVEPKTNALFAAGEARCVLRVGPPGEHHSEHRVLGREQLRSRYQSGTRSEKNPAYEVAKARLRQAEKAAKPGKSSIVEVGDPLIDLVGMLVGGALTGFGQWGAGDQLEEALDTLTATPASIDHPVYKSYHFARARVRASREAVLPVTLTDRQLQQSWQVSLKRRELRDLFVVDGLDRQDEDYARHSQDSLTESGLQQWLVEAPSPPLADIVTSLLDRPSAVPIDRLALAGDDIGSGGDGPLTGDESMDAAALPMSPTLHPRHQIIDHSPSMERASSSRITIIGETAKAEGVFIAPHFILTPSEVLDERGLVDIEDGPGHVVLGLVAAVDHGLGLALIQAPLAGRPVVLARGGPGRMSSPPSSAGRISTPILIDDQLAGFRTTTGPNIESDAIKMFLDEQQHLLPIDR